MTTINYDGTQSLNDAVVRFTATWCQPCKSFAPVFDKIAAESEGTFLVVDVDEHPEVAREYSVMSIPTVLDRGKRVTDYINWAKDELSNAT